MCVCVCVRSCVGVLLPNSVEAYNLERRLLLPLSFLLVAFINVRTVSAAAAVAVAGPE